MDVEIRTAMGLMGVTSLAQLNPSWVRPAAPVRPASQTNTYPLFEEQGEEVTMSAVGDKAQKEPPEHEIRDRIAPESTNHQLRIANHASEARAAPARDRGAGISALLPRRVRAPAQGARPGDGEGGRRQPARRHREPRRQRAAVGDGLARHGRRPTSSSSPASRCGWRWSGSTISRSRRRSRSTRRCTGASTRGC